MELVSSNPNPLSDNLPDAYRPQLTRRERQVVGYLLCGFKESAVAHSLGISPSTVHSHIASAHRKLGVASRARLVATVIAIGIIPVDEALQMLTQTGDC